MFYDLATRELLRTRKNPLTPDQVKSLRGACPAGPPPRPSAEPVAEAADICARLIPSAGSAAVSKSVSEEGPGRDGEGP
jgi:hypothetical protein